ncbi:hypothetical protein RI049_21570 [Cedecea neteri]|uniref:hypothetical protein n=1 Tax=Cedecea neteri TaxID=158822 RepID=UPI002AA6E2FB|nr:hypothetical protein [Cedecea neteri]WPU22588.1 hypothetical protein RI049_21570 [Cedecea neteri]
MEEITARERARLRKQRSRASQAKKAGLNRLELIINDQELAELDHGRVNRNPGREPYSRNEYIALLLLNDAGALKQQEENTPACKKCGNKPPEHCGGAFKGEHNCWLTIDCLKLNLTSVTGHSENKREV